MWIGLNRKLYKRHATVTFISDALSTLPLVDLVIFFIYWHEDNSIANQIPSYYRPFAVSFKTKFMTLAFTAEYHRFSNVLYLSAALQQRAVPVCSAAATCCTCLQHCSSTRHWPAALDLRTQSCPRVFFPFPAGTLNNLLAELVIPLSSTLKILLLVGICAFEILHLNYQNIWLLKLHWSLQFFQVAFSTQYDWQILSFA